MSKEVESGSNKNTKIVVAEGDFECGLLGFINCLQKEPSGEMISGLFISR